MIYIVVTAAGSNIFLQGFIFVLQEISRYSVCMYLSVCMCVSVPPCVFKNNYYTHTFPLQVTLKERSFNESDYDLIFSFHSLSEVIIL